MTTDKRPPTMRDYKPKQPKPKPDKPRPLNLHELIEALADKEHAGWARWQAYMHTLCEPREDGALVIPADRVAHWQREIDTPYADLPEREKEMDRDEVRHILPIIRQYADQHLDIGSETVTVEMVITFVADGKPVLGRAAAGANAAPAGNRERAQSKCHARRQDADGGARAANGAGQQVAVVDAGARPAGRAGSQEGLGDEQVCRG